MDIIIQASKSYFSVVHFSFFSRFSRQTFEGSFLFSLVLKQVGIKSTKFEGNVREKVQFLDADVNQMRKEVKIGIPVNF